MIDKDEKYEEKYYVFKIEDMDAALKMLNGRKSLCNGDPQKAFAEFCSAYDEYRRVHLGKGVNRYIVFNEDEPYAQFLYDFIVGNKDWKQFLPEEWAKLERQLRIAQNARDEQYFKAKKQEDELAAMSENLQDQGECCRRMEETINQLTKEIENYKELNKVMDGGGCAIAVSTGYTDYRTLNLPVDEDDCAKKPTVGGTTDPMKVSMETYIKMKVNFKRQLREKQCEIAQLRNDLQLAWNKIEDLTSRNEILESIHRQCPLTKPKSCTCRSDSQNSTGSSSKL